MVTPLRYETCTVSYNHLMTTVRAWWYLPQVWNVFLQFSSSHDKRQSMLIRQSDLKHAPSTVIVSWQRQSMVTPPQVRNMLHHFSSSHDNNQSMVFDPKGIKHALSVVIVSLKHSEHCDTPIRYKTCSVSYNCHMTMVRAWWNPSAR